MGAALPAPPLAPARQWPQPARRTQLLIVSGIGGEPRYSDAFYGAAAAMADAARRRFRLPDSSVVLLAEDPARDPARIAARSTKANVEQALLRLAARARPGDQLFVVLIGHGSHQGEESRFNLPGPDITAADFARLLARFPAQTVAFVNAASASGDFVRALAGENRAVVTATKTGFERNETRFARFFVDAFAGDGADVDKDGRVSLLEAFQYARREVARAYEADNQLLTEHAQLDDDGDGVGSAEPGPRAKDGALARRLWLTPGAAAVAAAPSDPRAAALEEEKRALEERIAALRQRKASMDAAAYERELEQLLVALALKAEEMRALAGGRP